MTKTNPNINDRICVAADQMYALLVEVLKVYDLECSPQFQQRKVYKDTKAVLAEYLKVREESERE